ncbi:MAG: TM2 domain-containing protein [Dongiaceae bacterium]
MSYDHPLTHDRDEFRRSMIEDTVFAARKSGLVAYLLWTVFGSVGLHNIYLGRLKQGLAQMACGLFIYCTYVADDPWSLIGLILGVPLSISLLVDVLRIPQYVVEYSERLRVRLQGDGEDWSAA